MLKYFGDLIILNSWNKLQLLFWNISEASRNTIYNLSQRWSCVHCAHRNI